MASIRLLCLVKAGLPKPVCTTANPPAFQGQIVQLLAHMQTNNYSDETTSRYTTILTTLAKRGTNLSDPENIKIAIAKQQWADGTKQTARNAAILFLDYYKIDHTLTPLPKYKHKDKIVFMPTETEIDQLIAGCKHQLATFIQTLKETAARYGEIFDAKWTDLNTESLTLSINQPEKGSNPRAPKISSKLLTMLLTLPHNTQTIFNYKNKDILRKTFQRARKRITKNLGNPRIQQIHFHTLRHWKATNELHKTNNIYTVMKLLGHKSLSNTQRYIGLLPDLTDDYVCEEADTKEQAHKLIENGYEYVTEMNGTKLFRKRK